MQQIDFKAWILLFYLQEEEMLFVEKRGDRRNGATFLGL